MSTNKVQPGSIPEGTILTLVDTKGCPEDLPAGSIGECVVSNIINGTEWITVKWQDPKATGGYEFGRHKLEQFSTEGVEPSINVVCSQCGDRLKAEVPEEIMNEFDNDFIGLKALKILLPMLAKNKWLLGSNKPRSIMCRDLSFSFKCDKCATKVNSKTV